MPPKKKFSKQQIIDVAFDIAKIEGIDKITIRKVATQLGSSIAPIYVNFEDVTDLIEGVIGKVVEVSQQILSEQSSGNPFRDIGIASIRFAREYPQLFRDLVLSGNDYMKKHDGGMTEELIKLMKQDPDLEDFTNDELKDILMKMKVFQTGLSVMVANQLLPENMSENEMVEMLNSAAEDVVIAARLRKKEK